jgi:LytS/YehU family sensor histidine kinase
MGLLLLWAVFAVLGTWFNYRLMADRNRPIPWSEAMRMNVAEYGIWAMVLTPLVLFLCAKLPLGRRGLFKLVPAHLLSIAGILCLDVCIQTLLAGWVFPGSQWHPFVGQFHRYFFSEAEADIQIYLLIAVIGYVVAYYSELRDQERRASELETNLVRAELQALKMQLQPHFLFNTLHSISALVQTDPSAATKMICSLGDLLRLTLAAEDVSKVALTRELEFLHMYLDIQKVRFRDRLLAEIHVADDVRSATVPYLLLQPLAENAIKHGVAKRSGLGKIEIRIAKDSEDVCISVVNDNCREASEHKRSGIGLENTRSRLRILYDSRSRLSTRQLDGGRFQVEVRFPFEEWTIASASVRSVPAGLGAVLELGR